MTTGAGRRRRRWLAVTAAVGGVAAAVAVARRARLEPMLVRGESMLPTLVPGQRIAVGPPRRPLRRGAVVVVRAPGPQGRSSSEAVARRGVEPADGLELVKRVVGLPGERVRLLGDRLEADGRELAEPWLARRGGPRAAATARRGAVAPLPPDARVAAPAALDLTLGPDQYLVLGDHRDASTDGRAFGPVGGDRIVGVVRFAYWPPRLLRSGRPPAPPIPWRVR
jgi:signal peptidase I